ncbi:hypothetical protein BC827DRAFT_1157312 [Russula dissimulans]|nr:hypothetical protein BC827DRAFT_1157312 [Russula dissimulans]
MDDTVPSISLSLSSGMPADGPPQAALERSYIKANLKLLERCAPSLRASHAVLVKTREPTENYYLKNAVLLDLTGKLPISKNKFGTVAMSVTTLNWLNIEIEATTRENVLVNHEYPSQSQLEDKVDEGNRLVAQLLEVSDACFNALDVARAAVSKTGSIIRKWQKKFKEFPGSTLAMGKVPIRSFSKDELSLFLPVRHTTPKRWAAFQVSSPHLPEWLKTRARERFVGNHVNGQYYILDVEDWNQPKHPGKASSAETSDVPVE